MKRKRREKILPAKIEQIDEMKLKMPIRYVPYLGEMLPSGMPDMMVFE